jgi:hypothetical protein
VGQKTGENVARFSPQFHCHDSESKITNRAIEIVVVVVKKAA